MIVFIGNNDLDRHIAYSVFRIPLGLKLRNTQYAIRRIKTLRLCPIMSMMIDISQYGLAIVQRQMNGQGKSLLE